MHEMRPVLISDTVAKIAALEIIERSCYDACINSLSQEIIRRVIEKQDEANEKKAIKIKHDIFFGKLFKAVAGYERKFQAMITGIWEQEQKIIIANLKKYHKYYHKQGEQYLYPQAYFERVITVETAKLMVEIMKAEGKRTVEQYNFPVAFDVAVPGIQEWIANYTPRFSHSLETVNIAKLKAELSEGIAAGEGIPKLIKRVNETYANWNKIRSESIARTETIRASNKAALESYIQNGVEKKQWLTFWDHRTCAFCEEMDGTEVTVKERFVTGDSFTIEREGKEMTLDVSYEPVTSPPLHPRCRCSLIPII